MAASTAGRSRTQPELTGCHTGVVVSDAVEMGVEGKGRRGRPQTLGVVIALLLLADLVAVATVGGSSTLSRVAVTDRIAAAANRTLASRSAHFTQATHIQIDLGGSPQSTDQSLDGVVDFTTHNAQEVVHQSGFTVETRVVGGVVYVKFPQVALVPLHLSKPWVAIPLPSALSGGASSSALAGQGDPGSTLRGLIATSKGGVTAAREVGHASIGGVQTTHYLLTVDPAIVSRQAHDALSAILPGFTPALQLHSMTLDEWIDAHGLVRQVVSTVDATVTLAGHSATEHVTSTANYDDFGVDVNVKPPPATEVTRVTSLTQLLGGLGGPGA